jgi:hypothetical protein
MYELPSRQKILKTPQAVLDELAALATAIMPPGSSASKSRLQRCSGF